LDCGDPLKAYLREIQTIPPLTKDEEIHLSQHLRAQDRHAEPAGKRLIEANLLLVVSIAERYRDVGMNMMDLIQKGNDGLRLALNTFAARSSDSFSIHAATCINDAISASISNSGTAR
jgi:RNA polymerase primary sigma factor